MVEYVLPIVTAVAGGTAAFWLAVIRGRVRLNLNLISITKGRNPHDTAVVGDRIIEISESFKLSDVDLQKEASDSEIQRVRSRARDVQEMAPEQIHFAREMKRRLWNCKSAEEKIDFMTELMSDGDFIFGEITTGVRHHQLILPKVDKEELRTSPKICEVDTRPIDGVECIVMTFPDRWHHFEIAHPGLADRLQPLADAIQIFNKEVLDECLKYAVTAIRDDHSRADILINGLGEIMDSGPIRVDLMVVNKGSRAAVLSPYAALRTSGATASLPALILKIETVLDSQNNPMDTPGFSYVSIEPNATATLILRSDPIESSEPLSAAYDKGILSCSIALVRLKGTLTGGIRHIVEETVRKDFGANFDEIMKNKVKELVEP